jgi:phosphonate transport system substrate-binding protein
LVLAAVAVVGMSTRHESVPRLAAAETSSAPPLRLAIVPERDIFEQRKRYRAIADYLGTKLGRRVEIVTEASYQGALDDLRSQEVDLAFLGSLGALLAVDEGGGAAMVRMESRQGVSTYTGVLVTPASSAIRSVSDLAGKRVAMVRTTTAGHLFPVSAMTKAGVLAKDVPGDRQPKFAWVGTHDDVLREVAEGRADVGAVKSTRLAEYERMHPDTPLRHLAESEAAPDTALVHRPGFADAIGEQVTQVLLAMDQDPAGRATLLALDAKRFVACRDVEYEPLRRMVRELGPGWDRIERP